MKPKPLHLALIAPALLLWSCAAPKAELAEETPATPAVAETKEEVAASTPEPANPPMVEDGIRLPDMLGMPGDGEFRTNRPAAGGSPGSGAVIARPPVE
jgi:hypothetical protein